MKMSQSSFRAKTILVKKSRGRKASSQRWLHRHLNDPYVQRAKEQGYRSRAVFKILEIHEKFHLFKPGMRIGDLGAAPGSWSQAVAPLVLAPQKGNVFAIDILPMEPPEGVTFVQGDFLDEQVQKYFQSLISEPLDILLSDMAAPTTGHATTDHIRTSLLADAAFSFARQNLRVGGTFIAKVFSGGTHQDLLTELKERFSTIKHFKPASSRKESPELYVICQGLKSPKI
jgi:23S rRNA (uridine2552-2'-O)-methyltransferase